MRPNLHTRDQGQSIPFYVRTDVSAMCILALNIVIDKIYLMLWVWFVIVSILGGIRVVCRVFQVASPYIRYFLMKMKMHRYTRNELVIIGALLWSYFPRYFKEDENIANVKLYITSCTIGDWFVLYQMSKNLNRRFFHKFLIQLSREFKELAQG